MARGSRAAGAGGVAGGVLAGTFPSPTFAVDMATQAELDAVAAANARLFSHFANAGNATTVETDLVSDAVAGATLAANGDALIAMHAGILVSSASATRQLRVYFGGSLIFDSGALSVSVAGDWVIDTTIVRVSATVVRYAVAMTLTGASLGAYANVGELTGLTLSGANVLKVTGQAAGVGAASNDLVAMLATVRKG